MLAGVAYVAGDVGAPTRAPPRSCSSASSGRRCCSPRLWARWASASARSRGTSPPRSCSPPAPLLARAGRGRRPTGGCTRDRRWSGSATPVPRSSRWRCCPTWPPWTPRRTGENRAGVYTGVWTAGETLGLALGPGRLRAGARARRLPSRPTGRLTIGPARLRADRDRARLLAAAGGADRWPACLAGCASYDPRRRRARGGVGMEPPSDRRARPAERAAGRRRAGHGGRTLAYVYDSGSSPRPTGSAARRSRRTPAPTVSTRPRSRAC